MKRIFVGGTGRSGTTILSRWLGSHPSIARFPVESRLIVDSGGILSLFNALTRDYSMDQARVAYRRFLRLMQRNLTNRDVPPYQGIDLGGIFGSVYFEALEELDGRLCIGSFRGWDFHSPSRLPASMQWLTSLGARVLNRASRGRSKVANRLLHPLEEMHVVRHFDSGNALDVLGQFLIGIFDSWANSKGAQGWCEDTPGNACHLDFLTRLIPESRHLCVVRNPYGTALSYTQQVWAPRDFSMATDLLASLFTKIIDGLDTLSQEQKKRVKVVRLEDLAERETKVSIRKFIGIDGEDSDGSILICPVSAPKERKRLAPEQRRQVESKLGFVIEYFGYDV